jgi:hypothetical protein
MRLRETLVVGQATNNGGRNAGSGFTVPYRFLPFSPGWCLTGQLAGSEAPGIFLQVDA